MKNIEQLLRDSQMSPEHHKAMMDANQYANQISSQNEAMQNQEMGQELASKGRKGDEVIGHLTRGDVVIPKDIAMRNPKILDLLKKAMEEEGGDYTTHIVGSDTQSINPETGMPEFGWKGIGGFFRSIISNPVSLAAAVITPFNPTLGLSMLAASQAPQAFKQDAKAPVGSASPTSAFSAQAPITRPTAMGTPSTLGGTFASMDPLQQRSYLATQGSQGGGLGQDQRNYYLNMLQRNIVDEGNNLNQQGYDQMLPIERQYTSTLGLDNSNPENLYRSISRLIA